MIIGKEQIKSVIITDGTGKTFAKITDEGVETFFSFKYLIEHEEKAKATSDIEWISVEERLPARNGKYLCCEGFNYRSVHAYSFAKNGEAVDEYRLKSEKNIFCYNDESGYYSVSGITHWAELPEMPSL